MTTSPVKNSAPIGRATFANDPADVLRPYADAKTEYLKSATVTAANGLASAEGEVRMALVNPPGMSHAADAA